MTPRRRAERVVPSSPAAPPAGARALRAVRIAAAALTLLVARPVRSAQVTGLTALHRDGQTFLTWTVPAGTGWAYWIYRSPVPIESSADLLTTPVLGEPTDSSWCDRRLYSLCGTLYGYAIDSLAAPLDSTRGLFVWTPDAPGTWWYAVTCVDRLGYEDQTITDGGNALVLPVTETPAPPRPVFQRTLIGPTGLPADVYTLWTANRDTPFFPAMCNQASEPYDCSLHHGAPGGGLMFHAHARGGSFYLAAAGSDTPGEWQLTMDDFVRTTETNTFWFGYHRYYDVEWPKPQAPPEYDSVVDYTARRVEYTLEWARRNFPVDTSRVYVMGNSMGGIAGVFLALWRPDLIAATMVSVPLFDFSFLTDPNPSEFAPDGAQRQACDRLWGTVATGLRMVDGTPVYDRLNAGLLARQLEARSVPPIIAFSGRNDTLIGWGETIPFYQAMRQSRAGGTFFWDTRGHPGPGAWYAMQDYGYVYRFRTNLSFPALSNGSADHDPGDGHAAIGDSIGTINGFVEWNDPVEDTPTHWFVRLTMRDLTTLWGPVVSAPESATVDVTPRRLQRFEVISGREYAWQVTRSSDGAIVQADSAYADPLGVLTIPAVKLYRSGSVLELNRVPVQVGVGSNRPPPPALRIGPLACPLRSASALAIEWPRAGEATVDLLDAAGRRLRVLFRGRVESGWQNAALDPASLPAGIYFLRARQAGAAVVRRIAILR